MARVSTQFSPALNGFRFINRFEINLPIRFKLPLAGMVDLNDVVLGLCGGMCFAALDYYYANKPFPDVHDVDSLDSRLVTFLASRQLDSLRIGTILKIIEWMIVEDKDAAARTWRYEVPKLRRMLDKGEPAVLCLIRVQGLDNPTKNHQVLATGYDFDPNTGCLSILVYEPNHPGEEVILTVNAPKPGVPAQLHQSSGEALRGFFVVPYKRQKNVPDLVPSDFAAESFSLEPRFRLVWPVDTHVLNQGFAENPEMYRPFKLPGHEGLDLYAPHGANIYACADGEVYQAEHPKNHPYGMQIRIKHEFEGKTYHTVYAHLSKALVKVGDKVKAGQRIGQADNTGNSFGSHLHLTLKIDGEGTTGYPKGIVDPWPYLKDAEPVTEPPPPPVNVISPQPPKPLPKPSGITVYTTGQVNLRADANTSSEIVATLPAGDALSVLGEAAAAKGKIGKENQWLQVQTASGQAGFVAAWLTQDTKLEAFPPSGVVVYPFDQANLRSGPGTGFAMLGAMTATDPLTVLGDPAVAKSKVGKDNEWLQVQTAAGQRGFVAAWLVHLTGQVAPATGLTVFPSGTINVRARPDANANILTFVTSSDALTVLGDKAQAQAKIGVQDQWLNVQTPTKYVGYVAAWFVTPANGGIPAESTPPKSGDQPAAGSLTVFPTADVNIRAQASANAGRVTGAVKNEPLTVVEPDLNAARARIGKQDQWVFVQKSDGQRGFVAAWFLSTKLS